MPEFEVGDRVVLISGGPVMVVSKVYLGLVYCVWFDDEKRVHTFSFVPATIRPA